MLFPETVVLMRGGGDLATGVAIRLVRSGFPVVISELDHPLTVRRTVAFSSAVADGSIAVEGTTAIATNPEDAADVAAGGVVAVVVSSGIPKLTPSPSVVVDARLTKRNIDTTRSDAPLVIALGPGFTAGSDCDAVVETARGHRLGAVIWDGSAIPDTGTPGLVAGRGRERVLRAPASGNVVWTSHIGATVGEHEQLGSINAQGILAPFDGMIRGLIAESTQVREGMKIGDVDPRIDPEACAQISDKALAVGGGVLEAVMTWLNQSN